MGSASSPLLSSSAIRSQDSSHSRLMPHLSPLGVDTFGVEVLGDGSGRDPSTLNCSMVGADDVLLPNAG